MNRLDETKSEFDLAVIGTGTAGNAAALFARSRGLSVVQIGNTGELLFSSGQFDIAAVNPKGELKLSDKPFEIVDAIRRDFPGHPYTRVDNSEIRNSFNEISEFLNGQGLSYVDQDENLFLPTSVGTLKASHLVPSTMVGGANAFKEKKKCLFVSIRGLKGFSGRQIAENLNKVWPGHSHATVEFPGKENEVDLYPEHMARVIEMPATLKEFADRIIPFIKDADVVGLPSILGLYSPDSVAKELEALLGVPVFEIPTMPPSLAGMRLKEVFEAGLSAKGVTRYSGKKVSEVVSGENGYDLLIDKGGIDVRVKAKGVVLATGRFTGGGLFAGRKEITETVLGLDVSYPEKRVDWLSCEIFDPKGHRVNRAGIKTDNSFRPLDSNGQVVDNNLYAVGSVLADQDWKREKSGAGISISSAYKAVISFVDSLAVS